MLWLASDQPPTPSPARQQTQHTPPETGLGLGPGPGRSSELLPCLLTTTVEFPSFSLLPLPFLPTPIRPPQFLPEKVIEVGPAQNSASPSNRLCALQFARGNLTRPILCATQADLVSSYIRVERFSEVKREAAFVWSKELTRSTNRLSGITTKVVKLDPQLLPPISYSQTRGPSDVPPYYGTPATQRPSYASERLPSIPLPQPPLAYSSGASSPRVSSIGSSVSSNGDSHSSFTSATSATSSNGPKTPSPNLPVTAISGPPSHSIGTYDHYPAMNSAGTDMYYPQHMSAGPAPTPQTVTSNALPHHYGHQQPPLLQPGPAQYSTGYPQYGYSNGLTSPQSAPPVSGSMGNVLPPPGVHQPGLQNNYTPGMDTTGQVAPPGVKPRVTATLWEDEGSLCFQVEARGICVARREDNHMINGTKLLNVAGMTRGRRDGILKSEKVRHVVKIGPMHLKGVWIPFERALDFANKEKITELLYPLFVHNIGALLYHPTNQTRTNQVMAAAERRKQEQNQMRNGPGGPAPPSGVLPSIQQHHHHMGLPGPQPSVPSHNSSGRPSLDRAHTFPTPPTSASSVMGSMASDNYQWGQQGMNGAQNNNPMSIDTGLSNARSMPATPATTPPGASLQSMQQYPQGTQAYDSSRGVYNAPPTQQAPYGTSNTSPQDRDSYGQSYMRGDMAPPTGRPSGNGEQDVKPPNGMLHAAQPGEQLQQQAAEDEAEHEAEYTHNSGAYDANRNSYGYSAPSLAPLSGDHVSGDIAGSDNHQAGSGRATPRTANPSQGYYSQQTGYNSPPRVQSSSNLYNVMSNDRAPSNVAPGGDVYGSQDMAAMQNGYAAPPIMNGAPGGMKRGRDDEDELPRPGSGGFDIKRRKMTIDGTMPATTFDPMNRPASVSSGLRR
ncbi:hypothetical protein SUNI508_10520 [Seiridium unicorne]|uniref:HTH APSES-type domain-containing protein n=1 Tax=Seiridium unicorne TaxID=138068 RepID=A0ABR2UL44_9PEZI